MDTRSAISCKLASIVYSIIYVIFSHVHLFPLLGITPIVLDYYVASQDDYLLYYTVICMYMLGICFRPQVELYTFFLGSTFMYTLSLILLCEYVDIKYSSNLLAESYMSSLYMCFNLRCQKCVQSHRRSIMLVSHLLPTSLSLSLVHIRMSSTTVSQFRISKMIITTNTSIPNEVLSIKKQSQKSYYYPIYIFSKEL